MAKRKKKKRARQKVGRKTKYLNSYNEIGYKLTLLGFDDAKLADSFNISQSTLNLWKKRHPEFSEAIKRGKEIADGEVVQALYKSATGHKVSVKRIIEVDGKKVFGDVEEYYAPHPTSGIFWLKNRQRDKWRDKQQVEVTGKNGSALMVGTTDVPMNIAARAWEDSLKE